LFLQLYKFSKRGHEPNFIIKYYAHTVNNDTTCFQATVAALAYLTAISDGLTCGYSAILLPQLRANSSGFEADEEFESWIGEGRDQFYVHTQEISFTYIHTQVNLPHNGAIELYNFFKFKSRFL
jgi:hypothetical protein